MRASELSAFVGQEGQIAVLGGLRIAVKVVDAKVAYGGVRVLIQPLDDRSGGQTWVEAGKVRKP